MYILISIAVSIVTNLIIIAIRNRTDTSGVLYFEDGNMRITANIPIEKLKEKRRIYLRIK